MNNSTIFQSGNYALYTSGTASNTSTFTITPPPEPEISFELACPYCSKPVYAVRYSYTTTFGGSGGRTHVAAIHVYPEDLEACKFVRHLSQGAKL